LNISSPRSRRVFVMIELLVEMKNSDNFSAAFLPYRSAGTRAKLSNRAGGEAL
jgi:hypothetical protein